MDDEVKNRFDDFDKRFQGLEKRFDDIKWYFGGAAAMFALFITLFTVIANSNLSSERHGLEEFKSELRADMGKAESIPDVEMLGLDERPLAGQELPAHVDRDKDGSKRLVFRYCVRNKGSARSGQMFLKIYTNDPINQSDFSSDEKEFKYELTLAPDSIMPNDIPGGNFTSFYTTHFSLDKDLPPGKYPILCKFYFGRGLVITARFVISV